MEICVTAVKLAIGTCSFLEDVGNIVLPSCEITITRKCEQIVRGEKKIFVVLSGAHLGSGYDGSAPAVYIPSFTYLTYIRKINLRIVTLIVWGPTSLQYDIFVARSKPFDLGMFYNL